MKKYDFDKAVKLIEENKDTLQSASLGMHEDWFWTAGPVWENGKYVRPLLLNAEADQLHENYIKARKGGMSILSEEANEYDGCHINGLYASDWATPTIQLIFKDDSDKMIPCYIGEAVDQVDQVTTVASKQALLLGVLSEPVQNNITPLSE